MKIILIIGGILFVLYMYTQFKMSSIETQNKIMLNQELKKRRVEDLEKELEELKKSK